jgi:hypothetical protein
MASAQPRKRTSPFAKLGARKRTDTLGDALLSSFSCPSPPPAAAAVAPAPPSVASSSLDCAAAAQPQDLPPAVKKYAQAHQDYKQAKHMRARCYDQLVTQLHDFDNEIVLTEAALERIKQVAEQSVSDFAFAAATGSGRHWKFFADADGVLPCDMTTCDFRTDTGPKGRGYYIHVFTGDYLCFLCYPEMHTEFERDHRTPDLPAHFERLLAEELVASWSIYTDTAGYKYEWRRLGPACAKECRHCSKPAVFHRRGTSMLLCEHHWHEAMGDRCAAAVAVAAESDG